MADTIQYPEEAQHRLSMTVLTTPDMANFAGNVHGGSLLKLADQAAYACASRYSGRYVVTLSVDQVVFKQSVHVGELLSLRAAVNYVGRTSMEVGIKVSAEDIRERICRHTNTCYLTMVAVDDDMQPVEIPPLTPQTVEEQRWHRAAELRRELRKEIQRRHIALREQAQREQS